MHTSEKTAEVSRDFSTFKGRLKEALRNEWHRIKRIAAFIKYVCTPRGSGVGPGVLQAALYFGIVEAIHIQSLIDYIGISSMGPWTALSLFIARLACYFLIIWSAGYAFQGILVAQRHARQLELEIERIKAALTSPAKEIVHLTHRVDALEAKNQTPVLG